MVKQSGQSAEHQDKVNQAITKAVTEGESRTRNLLPHNLTSVHHHPRTHPQVTEGHVSLLQLFGPIMDYATQTRAGRGLGQELMNVDEQQPNHRPIPPESYIILLIRTHHPPIHM